MKKGWKVFWGVCGVVALAGVVLCIVGAVLGGTLYGVGQVVERGAASLGINRDSSEIHGQYEDGETVSAPDESSDYEGIEHLEIDVAGVAVQILKSEDDRFRVETQDLSSRLNYRCYQDGAVLEIETEDWEDVRRYVNNQGYVGTIWVYVPERKLGEVSLSVEVGSLYVERLEARELSAETDTGAITLDDFTADELELNCGVGVIEGSGEILRAGEIECGVGSIQLNLLGQESDYRCKVEESTGVVTFGQSEWSGVLGEHYLGEGTRMIEVQNSLGNVSITFANS